MDCQNDHHHSHHHSYAHSLHTDTDVHGFYHTGLYVSALTGIVLTDWTNIRNNIFISNCKIYNTLAPQTEEYLLSHSYLALTITIYFCAEPVIKARMSKQLLEIQL